MASTVTPAKPSSLERPACWQRLTSICESLYRGIKQVKPGNHLGDIGFVIQRFAEKTGFSVVREYCGHGIEVFDEPQVLHYGKRGTGVELKPGRYSEN